MKTQPSRSGGLAGIAERCAQTAASELPADPLTVRRNQRANCKAAFVGRPKVLVKACFVGAYNEDYVKQSANWAGVLRAPGALGAVSYRICPPGDGRRTLGRF